MNILEDTIAKLIFDKPFLGYFFMSARKELTTAVPTAGVSVTDNINLYVNPEFFYKLSHEERVAVLEHEMMHIIDGHLIRAKAHPSHDKSVVNIAMDCAINQYIQNLPNGGVTLEEVRALAKDNSLKEEEIYEYYLEALRKQADKCQSEGEPKEGRGDHSKWSEGSSPEVQKAIIHEKAKDAVQRAKSAGKHPGNHIEAKILKMGNNEIPWNKVLKRYLAQAVNSLRESTRHKPNRRSEYMLPGYKLESVVNPIIVNDTSGSTAGLQNTFFTEIESLFNKGYNFKVVECDTQVQRVYDFKPKKEYSAKGYGGTLYTPAFAEAISHGADLIIFFGDGDSADVPPKPKVPVLWVLPEGCKAPVGWGKVVYLKSKVV